jgi:hypothetical protein
VDGPPADQRLHEGRQGSRLLEQQEHAEAQQGGHHDDSHDQGQQ